MTGGTKSKRHRWAPVHAHRKCCRDCGVLADQRPHPYARLWFTEWTLPGNSQFRDGRTAWNTLQGDRTPPCVPVVRDCADMAEAADLCTIRIERENTT